MYRIHAMVLLGLFATGIAGVPAGQPTTGCGGFSELQRVEVADANEREVVMGLIKRPADSIGAKHYHPSGEFGFILKGGVTVETEHEPKVTLKAGASFYQPPGGMARRQHYDRRRRNCRVSSPQEGTTHGRRSRLAGP